MSYSTGPKKGSQLQGHRKRRRTPIVFKAAGDYLDTIEQAGTMTSAEYNTVRQYFNDFNKDENGHSWIGGEGQGAACGDPIGTPYIRKNRILLREPERCLECGKVFISLYALKSCVDHEGLDQE